MSSPAMWYYQEGEQAYKDGKEMWQCPFVSASSMQYAMPAWVCGWMSAKQKEADALQGAK